MSGMKMHEEELKARANSAFYEFEEKHYPKGDTPYSDCDRELFVQAWIDGYLTAKSERWGND